MSEHILYHWPYNGVDHRIAEERILSKVGFAAQFKETILYYPILAGRGRFYTHNEEGRENHKIYCHCNTCQQLPENKDNAQFYLQLFDEEFDRIKTILQTAPDFVTKAKAWVIAGLDPFFRIGDEQDTIGLMPDDTVGIAEYNQFVYAYLINTDIGFIRRKSLAARIAEFETGMVRALYPDTLLADTKQSILSSYSNHIDKTIRANFLFQVRGKNMDWSTGTWGLLEAKKIVEAQEAFLFLSYLENYPAARLNTPFVQYAAAILAHDEGGMSWQEIAQFFASKANMYGVSVPFSVPTFPDDGSLLSKRSGFEQNMTAFSTEIQYKLLQELSTSYAHISCAPEIGQRLKALFGPLSKMFKGISNDLVSDVLAALEDYPKAKQAFEHGIEMIQEGKDLRSALDNLRVSMEFFLKQLLNNQAPLEKQQQPLGAYLKDNDVSVPIREMIWELVKAYTKYNNDRVKHDNKVEMADVNTMLYLTAALMHRILKTLI